MKIAVRSTVDVLFLGGSIRNVELAIREQKAGKSVLIATSYSYFGEDVCSALNLRKVPDFLKSLGVDGLATPMNVKRALDRLVIKEQVPFAFQAFALGIVGDCIIFADRSDIYAIRALAVVDDTPLLTIARKSGMPFEPFRPGKTRAIYRFLEDCDENAAEYHSEGRPYRLGEQETSVQLDSLDAEGYFRAEMEARLKLWKKEYRIIADSIELPELPKPTGGDPASIVFTVEQYEGAKREASELSADDTVDFEPASSFRYDVAVVGGGTAGAAAGIPGAQVGLKTLVLERLSHLGGTSTEGHIASYWYGLKIGFTKTIDERVREVSGAEKISTQWDVAVKEHVWEEKNAEAGTAVWFDSTCCHATFANGRIESIWAATPFGAVKISAEQFIDCTGNAELAYRCGAPTEFAADNEPAMQGAGMCPVVPGHSYFNTDYMFTVDSCSQDATRAFISGRDRFPNAFDLAQLPGTRERRRIIGEIVLKATDFYACRSYEDTLCIASSDFDTHGFTVDPLLIFHPTDSKPFIAEIPFRAFLSPGIDNLMTTGLGLSAQRDAMPLIRMIADVQNQGYVAGLLAANAVETKKPLRAINLKPIQDKLRGMGFMTPDKVIPASDLNQDAVIFSKPDIQALEKEFAAQQEFEKATRLAFLGSAIGEDILKQTVRDNCWDDGWNYRGMGQAGRATSRLDAAIMALSNICSDSDFLMPRLKEMEPVTQFSHYRAVCLFLMKHPSMAAAAELNRLLHCFQCHAVSDWQGLLNSRYEDDCDVEERNLQLRELYLAGALHACDPSNELAIYFLEQYKNGLHKLYSIYADKWK